MTRARDDAPRGRKRRCRAAAAYLPPMGTVAIFGAGVMGETLLSGLLRGGRSADDLVITERRAERAAELTEKYIRKGSQLYIEGKIQTRSWEKDGVKRYTTEIYAETIQLLGKRPEQSEPNGVVVTAAPAAAVQASPETPVPGAAEDDLPF